MAKTRSKTLFLFDVDGTLTKPRLPAEDWVMEFLAKVRETAYIAFVGGSDLSKIQEQLGMDCTHKFDYAFSQNGLVAMKNGELIAENSLKKHFGDAKLNKLLSFCLEYLAKLDIPIKRGTFIEFRSGMLNISPIGRNCSQEERCEFEQYDLKHNIRATMIDALKKNFPDFGVQYSIGGQISFDIFPSGWDKTYCLQFLEADGFDEIHFFGDKTHKGGNDYEIFICPKVQPHRVTSPEDTRRQVEEVLSSL